MYKDIKNSLIEISKVFKLDFLILFGSRSTNRFRENSDYDLAFFKKNISIDEEIGLRDNLDVLFKDKKYDLINLEKDHSYYLLQQIYQKGKTLYLSNKDRLEIEKENTFFNYVDSKQLLEPTKKAYLLNI
jgi:predicted nucleotidyltransferase